MANPSQRQSGPPTDVYEKLWVDNIGIAEDTYETPFIQHMELGDLQADYYVAFMIQDINYLVKVTDMLKKMSETVDSPEDLKKFMKDRFESYESYAKETLEEFHMEGVSEIIPTPAMKKYLTDYKNVMEKEDPIYFAVALLPCARLWVWLANRLKETTCNAYFTWKKENMDGHPEKHYKDLLDKYLVTGEQIEKANKIFRMQMQNERNFFASSYVPSKFKKSNQISCPVFGQQSL